MNKSESIAKLADALAKAQGAVKHAEKNKINPAFKKQGDAASKGTAYADLGAIFDACRDALSVNAIAVAQVPGTEQGLFQLTTILMHSSGEWLSGTYPIIPTKNDPQGVGSALSYARRYSLSSMVGIVADDDDDGNAASANGHKAATQANGNGHAYVTEKQAMDLETLADSIGGDKSAFLSHLKAGSFGMIHAADYDRAMASLRKKQAEKAAGK